MKITRGQFLRLSGSCLGGVVVGGGRWRSVASPVGDRMAVLYDAAKCVGCRACQVACKRWNGLPAESTDPAGIYESPRQMSGKTFTLIKLASLPSEGERRWSFCKYQCMHCTEASCVNVCPTGAAAHHGGYVVIDQNWCVGCGYCVLACPFGAVHLGEPEKGSARKCTFCFDRVTRGQAPACVQACPVEALWYGERLEVLARAEARVVELQTHGQPRAQVYGQTEVGGLGWVHVLADGPSVYGLPERPRVATAGVLAQWVSGLVAAGMVAALPFWLLFKRRRQTALSGSRGDAPR